MVTYHMIICGLLEEISIWFQAQMQLKQLQDIDKRG